MLLLGAMLTLTMSSNWLSRRTLRGDTQVTVQYLIIAVLVVVVVIFFFRPWEDASGSKTLSVNIGGDFFSMELGSADCDVELNESQTKRLLANMVGREAYRDEILDDVVERIATNPEESQEILTKLETVVGAEKLAPQLKHHPWLIEGFAVSDEGKKQIRDVNRRVLNLLPGTVYKPQGGLPISE